MKKSFVVRSLFVCGLALLLGACTNDSEKYIELAEQHQHTQTEINAYPYLGYYACERGITDLAAQSFSNGGFSCLGLKEGRLWIAYFDRRSTEQHYEWEDSRQFSREITIEASDGSYQSGMIESMKVKSIQSSWSEGLNNILIVLKYTLTNGQNAYQVFFDNLLEDSKSGILPAVDNVDVLVWEQKIIIVNDKIYNYNGQEIYQFTDDFEKPQNDLEFIHEYWLTNDQSDITRLSSVKVVDTKVISLEYIEKQIFWEYDFAHHFEGMEITQITITSAGGGYYSGEACVKFKAKDSEGKSNNYLLKISMQDGSLVSFAKTLV